MQMNPNPYGSVEIENFSVDCIRNFSIIAHVGKDTRSFKAAQASCKYELSLILSLNRSWKEYPS